MLRYKWNSTSDRDVWIEDDKEESSELVSMEVCKSDSKSAWAW